MKRRTEREHLFITFLHIVIAALVGSFFKPDRRPLSGYGFQGFSLKLSRAASLCSKLNHLCGWVRRSVR